MITETENTSATAASSADILRDNYAHWRETKLRHGTLKSQLEKTEERMQTLRKELVQLQERRQQISNEHGYTVGNLHLSAVDAERGAVEGRKTEAEDAYRSARTEFERAEVDLSAARQVAEVAREKFCFEQAALLETKIRDDKNLRKRLIEAFAAIVSAVDPELPTRGIPNWGWFVRELFLAPEDAELAEPVARFKREHITPLIGE